VNATVPNPEPERDRLPAVDAWAAMSDEELTGRLRAAADHELAGMDAATPEAEALADLLTPEPVHYDPDIMVRLAPCGLDLHELAREHVTTDPAQVTCPVCTASLVDGQLPPEPVVYPERPASLAPRDDLDLAVTAERRTVGLEVLTAELRFVYSAEPIPAEAKVAIVLRESGEPVLIADTDVPWTLGILGPVKALRGLLTEMISGKNRLEREDGRPVELLMPTPDVLAALAGHPVGGYTAALDMTYGTAPIGSLLRTETAVDGAGDLVWQELTARTECPDDDCPAQREGVQRADCRVVIIGGRGGEHVARWWPVSARVPATTEVQR
jgi:hypothetical protein